MKHLLIRTIFLILSNIWIFNAKVENINVSFNSLNFEENFNLDCKLK